MRTRVALFCVALLRVLDVVPYAGSATLDPKPDAKQIVRQVVETEIAANRDDHSRWSYFDLDQKPGNTVRQWVAETGQGDLHRVLADKGRMLGPDAQRRQMDEFIRDPTAQARQRKSGANDDRQSEQLLRLLPDAFLWSMASAEGDTVRLHFAPDPNFKPPSWETRVFAAMEGEISLDSSRHRIASLRGRLVRDVRFCAGLCGSLSAGGTFDIQRRRLAPSVWQIVETMSTSTGRRCSLKTSPRMKTTRRPALSPYPGTSLYPQPKWNS
jgi:hypothetical protein